MMAIFLDGYQVYNPKAVISLMTKGKFRSYWSETGSYEVVIPLICMKRIKNSYHRDAVWCRTTMDFKNDPAKIQNRDDVITYLMAIFWIIKKKGTAFLPNEEVRQELT